MNQSCYEKRTIWPKNKKRKKKQKKKYTTIYSKPRKEKKKKNPRKTLEMLWHRPGAAYFCALKPYFLCNYFTFATTKCTNKSSSITVMATKTIGESDVGILSYISALPGFRGILKQRSQLIFQGSCVCSCYKFSTICLIVKKLKLIYGKLKYFF